MKTRLRATSGGQLRRFLLKPSRNHFIWRKMEACRRTFLLLMVVRPVFLSDPRHPMEIPGTSFPGAADARPFEQQAEVRTFTSDVLKDSVEWTGRIRANLFLSSTAPDTDVIVRVSDVYPGGRSILIVDYPQRVRHRDGFDHETVMTPGEIVRYHSTWAGSVRSSTPGIRFVLPLPAPEHRCTNQILRTESPQRSSSLQML